MVRLNFPLGGVAVGLKYGPVTLAILLAMGPSAMAGSTESGSGQFDAPDGIALEGAIGATGHGAIYTSDARHAADVKLEGRGGTMEIVTVRVKVLRSPMGAVALAPEVTTRVVHGVIGAVSFEPLASYQLVTHTLSSGPSARLELTAIAEGQRPRLNVSGFHYSYKMNATLPYFPTIDLDGPGIMVDPEFMPLDNVVVRGSGLLRTIVANAIVHGTSQNGTFFERVDQHREPLLGAGGSTTTGWVDVYSYASIDLEDASVEIQGQDPHDTRVFVASRDLRLDGTISCPSCSGAITLAGRSIVANREPLRVEGVMIVSPSSETDETGRFHVYGDLSDLSLRSTLVGPDGDLTRTGVGAALLIAAIAAISFSRETVGSVLGTLFTRLSSKDVLESAERAAIVGAVRRHRGIHLRELQRTLGFGWGKLHYHLRVLERGGHLTKQHSGKHVQLYPRPDEHEPADALRVRGAAFAIYQHAVARGITTVADVQSTIGISRQLAHYHVSQLVASGFLCRVEGARGTFAPTPDATRA